MGKRWKRKEGMEAKEEGMEEEEEEQEKGEEEKDGGGTSSIRELRSPLKMSVPTFTGTEKPSVP